MTLSPELEKKFETVLASYPEGRKRSAVIPLLMFGQDELGKVSQDLVEEIAKRCQVTPLQVDEVVGYYSMLHKGGMGMYHVQVCTNLACLLAGGEELYQQASKKLGLGHKQVSADRLISLEEVECIGACSWAPAMQINYDFHHHLTPEKLDVLLDSLRKVQ